MTKIAENPAEFQLKKALRQISSCTVKNEYGFGSWEVLDCGTFTVNKL